jgi:hypothetical protein
MGLLAHFIRLLDFSKRFYRVLSFVVHGFSGSDLSTNWTSAWVCEALAIMVCKAYGRMKEAIQDVKFQLAVETVLARFVPYVDQT